MADGFQEVPLYAPLEKRREYEELNQDEGEEEEKTRIPTRSPSLRMKT